jgi:TrpR-related protein YerC/YecD
MTTRKRFTDDSFRREPWFKSLCEAILSCKNEADLASFLRDIGTLSELQAWSERLEVAKQIARGLSYREIATKTGASTTTVTRVAKFIENGEGGYRKVLKTHRHHRMGAQTIVREAAETVTNENLANHQPEQAPKSSSPLQRMLEKHK